MNWGINYFILYQTSSTGTWSWAFWRFDKITVPVLFASNSISSDSHMKHHIPIYLRNT